MFGYSLEDSTRKKHNEIIKFNCVVIDGICQSCQRGNGNKNRPFLIGEFDTYNIGATKASGIFAFILANIFAIFLLRIGGKNLVD